MTYGSLTWLGGVTACAVALAIATSFTWTTNDAISERGNTLVPSMPEQVNAIHLVKIETGDDTQMFTRKDDGFVDTSGYPAKLDAVRDLVKSVAALTIEEKKTADPARHDDLDLAAPGSEQGAGTKVELIANGGSAIASLIVGKSDYSVGGVGGGQYVRAADEDQSYLVRGSVKLPYGRSGWFDTELYDIGEGKIVRATLSGAGPDDIIVQEDDGSLTLATVPDDKVADEAKIGRIGRSFGPLSFEDVRSAGDSPPADQPSLSVETDAGLRLKIDSVEVTDDEKRWVRIAASGSNEESEATAQSLTEKLDGFEFKLDKRTGEILGWTVDDLTRSPES